MSSEPTENWAEPLPRGRHKLPPETVRDSQRERLLRAMLEVVAESGYAAATVSQVAASARVSPNRFYAFFSDKADCFLQLCDEQADELLGLLAGLDRGDLDRTVDEGMRIYLQWWQERPEVSRAYLVELPTVGERAAEQRDAVIARYTALFAALGEANHTELAVLMRGITDVVAAEVRQGRLDQLPELHAELAALLKRVLAG